MADILYYELPGHLQSRRAALRRERVVQIIAAVLLVLCLVSAAFLVRPINALRLERQLVIDPETIRGLPPDLTILGKLGTFRALIIDWASIRADRLKEEGKTYEALQLHEMVCALAPRFPKVWINAGWNMAYNISVMKYSPQERWQWVQNGIKILRDRGIKYNPKSVRIHQEIAWIYWHKIGDFLDDEHLNYKRALAVEMEGILGPPPVTLRDREYLAWFQKIVDAPRDVEALIASDYEVARVAEALRTVELGPDDELLRFVARYVRPDLRVEDLMAGEAMDDLTRRRLEVIKDSNSAAALDRLLSAVRSKILREEQRLDVDWMFELMKEYGPLDWRNPFAHTLYWSSRGDKLGRGRKANSINDLMTNARFVFFSLQSLITRGRITLTPDFEKPFRSHLELTPDIRYIPYLFKAYMRLGEEHFKDDPRYVEPPGPVYKTGLVSAMQNWVELLVLEGGEENVAQAENYFAWLREHNPALDGTVQEQYQTSVEEFVMKDIYSQLQTYKAASGFIRGFINRAFKHWSLGQERPAAASFDRARKCYDIWMIDTRVDLNDRRKMPAFPWVVQDELGAFFRRQDVAPLYKAKLWRALTLELRQGVYDSLHPYFVELCEAQDPRWEVTKAFTEPPGMDEFRLKQRRELAAPRENEADRGESKRQ